MPVRRVLVRALAGLGLVVVAALAVLGGLALGGSGTLAVLLAGTVAGCLAAGMVQDVPDRSSRRAAVDVAWRGAAWTISVLLLLSGIAAIAGATATTVVAGLAAAVAGGLWLLRRAPRQVGPVGPESLPDPGPAGPVRASGTPAVARPTAVADGPRVLPLPPVPTLSTAALGSEWLRTSRALTQPMDPGARQSLVRRRQETLDELERRDPEGFARWLAAGAAVDSDPAAYVQEGPAAA